MSVGPTDLLVRDVAEAEARKVMAIRAALAPTWENRKLRAELLADVNERLEEYNLLVLGR